MKRKLIDLVLETERRLSILARKSQQIDFFLLLTQSQTYVNGFFLKGHKKTHLYFSFKQRDERFF